MTEVQFIGKSFAKISTVALVFFLEDFSLFELFPWLKPQKVATLPVHLGLKVINYLEDKEALNAILA